MNDQDPGQVVKQYLKNEGIEFDGDCCWDELAEHVQVHKYYLDMENGTDIDWQVALDSWYETVFTPLLEASASEEVHKAFPGKSSGQHYLDVSHHWMFMKLYQPDATPQMAAHDLTIRHGEGLERWYKRLKDSGLY